MYQCVSAFSPKIYYSSYTFTYIITVYAFWLSNTFSEICLEQNKTKKHKSLPSL